MNLIERQTSLSQLNRAWNDFGRLVFIAGEAGIGKTTLLQHFVHSQIENARLLWGACEALFTPRPLGPLHDFAPQTAGELPHLLQDEQTNRPLIFSTLLKELQAEPTIAVVEDAHWADEATLDLLKFLGRRIHLTQSLLLVTYRDDELTSRHPLRILLGDLATSAAVGRIALAPLTVAGVGQLIGNQDVDARSLHQLTNGNPFYVTEVLATEQEEIPPTVRDAVLARAARLSPSGRAVLDATAVIGPRIEPWLLSEVTRAEAQAVDESLSLGILQPQGDLFVFRHELARQVILDAILPHHRTFLHQAVLDALKTLPSGRQDFAQIVHHAEAANDSEAIIKFAPKAARNASGVGAHRTAANLFQLAIQHGSELPIPDVALLVEAHARECLFINEASTVVASRRRAVELWRKVGNALKEGENLALLALALNMLGEWPEATQAGQDAVTLLTKLPPGRELALAYRTQALQHLCVDEYAAAIALAEQAVTLAEQAEDVLILGMAYDTLGSAWLYSDFDRGSELLRHGLNLAASAGLDARVATIYANLGSVACELGRFRDAEEILLQGLEFTEARDLDHLHLYLRAWHGATLLYLGRWQEAETAATEVLGHDHLAPQSHIPALVVLGKVQSRRGQVNSSGHLNTAFEIATASGQFHYLAPVIEAKAEAACLLGDLQSVIDEARHVYNCAADKAHPWYAGALAYWLQRAGDNVEIADWMTPPFARQIDGDWAAAAAAWAELRCPYERARALADGDTEAQKEALHAFELLGAKPMAELVRQKLRAAGVRKIPRGPRASTSQNPFGLTNRQTEILELLTEHLTNAEIGARLFISTKTVDHHVSAILAKLNVSSRSEAVHLAQNLSDR